MSSSDPRLADVSLLVLAAMRARHRRQVPDWREGEGISALLGAAQALPQRAPWDLPALEPRDGLARLLAEARQWHKEDADGA